MLLEKEVLPSPSLKINRIKILCIDDEYVVRKSMASFLEKRGFEVYQAENGKLGLEKFNEISPDVVLVDIKMPEISGLEVLENLRNQVPDVPVIIVSGASGMVNAIEAIRLGAWDFITKPIYDYAILEHTIRRELERSFMLRELKGYQEHLEDEIAKRTEEVQKELKERKLAQEALNKSLSDLEQIMNGTIASFGQLSEVRDPYTAGHQRRVAKLGCAIGCALGLSEFQCKGLKVAATLHDVGKIYIPAEILNKPGKLTELEFGLIKTHPQIGFDILNEIPFPWPIAEIVMQHHERLDGSGYPRRYKSPIISIEARIIAVSDVVEAMSSHRPYRPALGMDLAIKEIKKGQGTIYDTFVVEACLRLMGEQKFRFED